MTRRSLNKGPSKGPLNPPWMMLTVLAAVALTAFADKGYARSALLGGYQVHVPKPVDPNDLIAVVATLTGRTGNSPPSTEAK